MNRTLYSVIQWTWGLPQTLIGSAVYLIHRDDNHFDYNGARVTVWNKDSGISLGKFLFVPSRRKGGKDRVNSFILEHEYGHSIQSLILGPAYLILIGAPSMIWNRLPYFNKHRARTGRSYYSVPFEKNANVLGAKAAKASNNQKKGFGPRREIK